LRSNTTVTLRPPIRMNRASSLRSGRTDSEVSSPCSRPDSSSGDCSPRRPWWSYGIRASGRSGRTADQYGSSYDCGQYTKISASPGAVAGTRATNGPNVVTSPPCSSMDVSCGVGRSSSPPCAAIAPSHSRWSFRRYRRDWMFQRDDAQHDDAEDDAHGAPEAHYPPQDRDHDEDRGKREEQWQIPD
jgi:hypothetical protein